MLVVWGNEFFMLVLDVQAKMHLRSGSKAADTGSVREDVRSKHRQKYKSTYWGQKMIRNNKNVSLLSCFC